MVTPPSPPSRLAFSVTKVKELRDATRFLQFHISLLQSATISKVQETLEDLLTAASRVEKLLKKFGSDAKKERDVGLSEGRSDPTQLQGVKELDITVVANVVQDLENLIKKAEEAMEVWRKIETKLGGNVRATSRRPKKVGLRVVNVPDDEDWLGAFEFECEQRGLGVGDVGNSKRKRGGVMNMWREESKRKLGGLGEGEGDKRRRH